MRIVELKSGVVKAIYDTITLPEFSKPFSAIEILGDDPKIGDVWDGSVFTTPIKATHRKKISLNELIDLLDGSESNNHPNYAKIYRAAYPSGNKPEDDFALHFLETLKNASSKDALADVGSDTMLKALDHFVLKNYIDLTDKDRVIEGVEIL